MIRHPFYSQLLLQRTPSGPSLDRESVLSRSGVIRMTQVLSLKCHLYFFKIPSFMLLNCNAQRD